MAYTQFKGFKRVLTGNTAYNSAQNHDDFLYFVRKDANATEGEIWFQGMCYGRCRDTEIDALNTALEGFLTGQSETGYTNVKEYIDNAIAQLEAGFDSEESGSTEHVSVDVKIVDGKLDKVEVAESDIASASALTQEISDREAADTALQTEIDAIETAVGLSTGGTYVPGDGHYTSGATSVADAIDKLDDALTSAVTDLEEAIEDKINELDADESGASTYVNVRVQEVDGVITEVSVDDSALESAIEAMDLAEVHEAGKAIVAVSEEDGKVSATAGTIAAQYVDVADVNENFDADNVEDALTELYCGYTGGDAAIVGDATESGNTLGKLEDRIEELSADAKEYHLVHVTTGLSAEIKEEYYLADADGNQSGATISIPKDSHIVSITYITDSADTHYQNLEYEYIDVCGNTRTEYVDMSQLVLEQEFASGVGITNHVAHGVVDPQSEEFLTVGADGFKLSGVQDAIDEAAAAATTKVEKDENSAHLTVTPTTGADGSVTYIIGEDDIASDTDLQQEASDRQAADEALSGITDDLQNEIDAIETAIGLSTGGTYVPGAGEITSGATSVSDAIQLLDAAVGNLNDNLADVESNLTTAITTEASARTEADEELQEEIDDIKDKYLTGVTVNGNDATVANNHATVTIDAGDIEIGSAITGDTGDTIPGFDADDKVDDVLQGIVDAINRNQSGAYTGVTSSDGSITVTGQTNGQDIVVNTKTLALADVQNGETEVKKEQTTGALYGVMYWIDEETA